MVLEGVLFVEFYGKDLKAVWLRDNFHFPESVVALPKSVKNDNPSKVITVGLHMCVYIVI